MTYIFYRKNFIIGECNTIFRKIRQIVSVLIRLSIISNYIYIYISSATFLIFEIQKLIITLFHHYYIKYNTAGPKIK